jgi:hypothetical protein
MALMDSAATLGVPLLAGVRRFICLCPLRAFETLASKTRATVDEGGSMMSFSTRHTRDTQAPQDYWQHAHHTINHRFRSITSGTANSWPQ